MNLIEGLENLLETGKEYTMLDDGRLLVRESERVFSPYLPEGSNMSGGMIILNGGWNKRITAGPMFIPKYFYQSSR